MEGKEMKTVNVWFLTMAIMMGAVLAAPLYANEPAQVAADHLAMAASYEQKAAAQDALIAEHQQMKKDEQRFYINDKVTPKSNYTKMNMHCDKIIQGAQDLKAELLEFAKWHKMRAAELQGQ